MVTSPEVPKINFQIVLQSLKHILNTMKTTTIKELPINNTITMKLQANINTMTKIKINIIMPMMDIQTKMDTMMKMEIGFKVVVVVQVCISNQEHDQK